MKSVQQNSDVIEAFPRSRANKSERVRVGTLPGIHWPKRRKRAPLNSPWKLHNPCIRNLHITLCSLANGFAVTKESICCTQRDFCSESPFLILIRMNKNVRTPGHHYQRMETRESRNIAASLNRPGMH